MQCPYCGNEMRNGVISFNTRYKTVWRSKDDSKEIKKIFLTQGWFDDNEMDAAFCNSCNKMILDLGELKKPDPLFVFMKPRDDGTLTR